MAESEEFEVDGLTRGADHYFADYIKPPKWAAKNGISSKSGSAFVLQDVNHEKKRKEKL